MKYSSDDQLPDLNTLDNRLEDHRAHASRVDDVAISQLYWYCWIMMVITGM